MNLQHITVDTCIECFTATEREKVIGILESKYWKLWRGEMHPFEVAFAVQLYPRSKTFQLVAHKLKDDILLFAPDFITANNINLKKNDSMAKNR